MLCPHSIWQTHTDRDVRVVITCNISRGKMKIKENMSEALQ